MKRWLLSFPLFAGLVSMLWASTPAVVIIPAEPEPTSEFAARELSEHIGLALGAEIPIVREGDANPNGDIRRFWVGPTAWAAEQGVDTSGLEAEQVVIRSVGNNLIIAGQDRAGDPLNANFPWVGTLWGVYEVLERDYGVVWAFPGDLGRRVPPRESLAETVWDETFQPVLVRRRLREVGRNQNYALGWTPEQRLAYLEAERTHLRRHRMGRSEDPRPYAGHSFGSWWRDYGESNPEFFQLNPDGSRGPRGSAGHRVAMCVSNPDLQREIVRRFVEAQERNPERPPILSIGENDVHAACICEPCVAMDDPQPTPEEFAALPRYARGLFYPYNAAGRYARFWKAVYELAREEVPDVVVTAFVYSRYFVAPQGVELHPNIVLSFCPWSPRAPELPRQRNWLFPRFEDEQAWLMDQWDQWRATGATLYYRPNYTLDGYTMPHVASHQFAETMQHFLREGAIGFDFDALVGQWSAQGPYLYLVTRLHQKPDAEVSDLLNEYYSVFGPAADAVRDYFDYWETHTLNLLKVEDQFMLPMAGRRITHYPTQAHRMFPPAAFAEGFRLLDLAKQAADEAEDEQAAARVHYLHQGLEMARLSTVVAEAFADRRTSADDRRKAIHRLAEFRTETAPLFIANYHWIHRAEGNSWAGQSGFPE